MMAYTALFPLNLATTLFKCHTHLVRASLPSTQAIFFLFFRSPVGLSVAVRILTSSLTTHITNDPRMMTARIYHLLLLIAAVGQSLAFSSVTKSFRPPTAVMASRRAFLLDVPLTSAAAAMVLVSAPAFADNDDLAMPTAEEIEEQEVRRMNRDCSKNPCKLDSFTEDDRFFCSFGFCPCTQGWGNTDLSCS